MQMVLKGAVLPQPTETACHDDVYAVVKRCCDAEPDKRPTPRIIVRDIRSLLTRGLSTSPTQPSSHWFNHPSFPISGLFFNDCNNDVHGGTAIAVVCLLL